MGVDRSLDGRVAVVTGASKGLGREIALSLATAGADLVLAARSMSGLAETAADVRAVGRRALVVSTDVTRWDEVDRLAQATLAEYGRADILVNNSGVVLEGALLDIDVERWHQIFDVNVHGVFYGCKAFGPIMRQQGGGCVINLSSTFATVPVATVVGYCASKAAVSQMTRALANEWARYNIRVNAIAPGYFETDMNAAVRSDERAFERILHRIPQRRFGRGAEIGPLVLYLVSDAAAYMTGEVIVLDGGMAVS